MGPGLRRGDGPALDHRPRVREHPAHLRLEAVQRIDVEGRIEGGCVPVVDQLLGEGIPALALEPLAPLGILAEMLEIIAALEFLVPVDCVVDVLAYIRLEHFGGDRAVIGDREELAEIVAERRHDLLVACPGTAGEGAGHQRVGKLVGGEADFDRLQPGEAVHDLARGHALLVLAMLGRDMRPILGLAVPHVGEHRRISCVPAEIDPCRGLPQAARQG